MYTLMQQRKSTTVIAKIKEFYILPRLLKRYQRNAAVIILRYTCTMLRQMEYENVHI